MKRGRLREKDSERERGVKLRWDSPEGINSVSLF